jgi:hypothetical protein
MARRKVTVRDIGEILDHLQSGRGIRAIARFLGVCRPTIRKYVAIARSHGYEVGGLSPPEGWRRPVRPLQECHPLFPNPLLADGVLDRLIKKAYHVIINGKSYRPRLRPDRVQNPQVDTSQTETVSGLPKVRDVPRLRTG